MEVISPITWEYLDKRAIMEQEFMRGNANCDACGECHPRIVAEYRITRDPPRLMRQLRAVCMTSGTNLEIRPGLRDLVREGTLLLRVPDAQNNAEGPTDPQEIQVMTDNNQAIMTTEDGTDSEDEEWREHIAHHHHAPPESQ